MSSDYFPVDFSEVQGQILSDFIGEGGRDLDGVTVDYFGQKHPGDSWAFSFTKDGHKVVYATDSEIDLLLPNKDAINNDLEAPRQIPADLIDSSKMPICWWRTGNTAMKNIKRKKVGGIQEPRQWSTWHSKQSSNLLFFITTLCIPTIWLKTKCKMPATYRPSWR